MVHSTSWPDTRSGFLCTSFQFRFCPAVILSVLFTAALGSLLYRFVLLRIRGLVISEVIATFGVGLAILELFRHLGFTGFEYTLPVFSEGIHCQSTTGLYSR